MSTQLLGPSFAHHFTLASLLALPRTATLSPKFTSFTSLSPLLGKGEPQNLHAATLLALGYCIWPETSQMVQFLCILCSLAFRCKLSLRRDKPRTVLQDSAPHHRMFLTMKPDHLDEAVTPCPISELLPWSLVNGTVDAIHFPWGIDSYRFRVAKKTCWCLTVSHQPSRELCSRCRLIACRSPSASGTSQP